MMALGLEPILSSKSIFWTMESQIEARSHSCRTTGVLQGGKEFRVVHKETNHSALINRSFGNIEMAPLDKGAEGSSIF